jgi:DNA-binding response OmpR family regulator
MALVLQSRSAVRLIYEALIDEAVHYAMLRSRTWTLIKNSGLLVDGEVAIALTKMECSLLDLFTISEDRAIKSDVIVRFLKKPYDYSGLCMAVTRLQRKFKDSTDGDKLFASVRNCGYCLVQKIDVQPDLLSFAE